MKRYDPLFLEQITKELSIPSNAVKEHSAFHTPICSILLESPSEMYTTIFST